MPVRPRLTPAMADARRAVRELLEELDLEPGKWVKLGGWQNKAAAEKVLADGYANYKG